MGMDEFIHDRIICDGSSRLEIMSGNQMHQIQIHPMSYADIISMLHQGNNSCQYISMITISCK